MSNGQQPPTAPVKQPQKGFFQRVSIVWIVPVIALLVVLAVAWRSYAERGPLIEISFENAAGIRAGESELRYRDVKVGLVESIEFSGGLDEVIVSVRLNKNVADYVDSGSRFWIVRPQITTQGVSGLDTVLSGVFIRGLWDSDPGGSATMFKGLDSEPLDSQGQEGLRIKLRAAGKVSLAENTPILYRGIKVGAIGRPAISADGTTAEAEAVIYAPHDRLINSSTRFWDTSGFSFSLGPSGAEIDFSSISSLLAGGVTFDTLASGGDPAEPGYVFNLYDAEPTARASIFAADDGEQLVFSAIFRDNIAGLTAGAPVELNGLKIGQVTGLNGLVDKERFGDSQVHLVATFAIRPGRLGLGADSSDEEALEFMRARVKAGLRARLATASILTGGLKIELVEIPTFTPVELSEIEGAGYAIPTTKSAISDVQASAKGVLERINALPVEEVMDQAINLLANMNAVIGSEETRAMPGNLNGLLADARNVVSSDEIQNLPKQISDTISELNQLVAQFNEQAIAGDISTAVKNAAQAAESVDSAMTGVPELIERLNAVAAKAETLEIEKAAEALTSLMKTTDTLLASDAMEELPGRVNDTLTELGAILADLRESDVSANIAATLQSASNAADKVAQASDSLPAIIEEANQVLAQARETLAGFESNSVIGRDLRAALQEVKRAAQSVSSLAKAIERKPNSLLTGK